MFGTVSKSSGGHFFHVVYLFSLSLEQFIFCKHFTHLNTRAYKEARFINKTVLTHRRYFKQPVVNLPQCWCENSFEKRNFSPHRSVLKKITERAYLKYLDLLKFAILINYSRLYNKDLRCLIACISVFKCIWVFGNDLGFIWATITCKHQCGLARVPYLS